MRYFFWVILLGFMSCNTPGVENNDDSETSPSPATSSLSYHVIAQHPHDTSAYTQGLQMYHGKLFEGTGDYEHSSLRITEMTTGKVIQKHLLGDPKLFGEGITILHDKIYQLTWQNNVAYQYKVNDINQPVKTFKWPYEGWGITNNGRELIISDGSSNLYFTDTNNLRVLRTIAVMENNRPIEFLNELEYIDGFIYANIYLSSDIVKIDPETGDVKGRLSFQNLLTQNDIVPGRTDVLNGIAYDSSTRHLIITGKRWPKLFEVEILK